MQCAAVSAQFGQMMEPSRICDPEYRTDTWNSNMHYHVHLFNVFTKSAITIIQNVPETFSKQKAPINRMTLV